MLHDELRREERREQRIFGDGLLLWRLLSRGLDLQKMHKKLQDSEPRRSQERSALLAEALFVPTVEALRKQAGPDGDLTLSTSNNLAILYLNQGRYRRAEATAEQLSRLGLSANAPGNQRASEARASASPNRRGPFE